MRGYPDSFGEYECLRLLGTGSYGQTFLVRKGRSKFALKWLLENVRPEGEDRFENEAWALKTLNHAAIPKFIDAGVQASRPYVVMSLMPGKSIRQLLHAQERWGGSFGEKWVLTVLERLFEVLVHLEEKNIFHRDIKDDNVIVNNSVRQVSLIDFGFCKSHEQPKEVATPRNAGKIWFSPPSKLRHPSSTHPTHDVFAVGVLGYLMLTKSLPWMVSEKEDAGHLERLMLSDRPELADTLNSLVTCRTAATLEELLEVNDDIRPLPNEALLRVRAILGELSKKKRLRRIVDGPKFITPRVFRDPIHGDIRLTEYEKEIIDTPEFQRLRYIKQLGFTHLVFHGAEHSRFSHSLGTLWCADKILLSLEQVRGVRIVTEERLATRLFALVHDTTHISFGHTLEDELAMFKRHDKNQSRYNRLVKAQSSAMGKVLRKTDFGRVVAQRMEALLCDDEIGLHESNVFHFEEVISGAVGADVLDYIDRDSTYCGLDHRVDSAIFRNYRLAALRAGARTETHLASGMTGSHGLRLDKEFAFESLLLERFALFLKAYTHPTKVAAGAMLGKALHIAGKSAGVLDRLEKRIEWLSDTGVLHMLAQSRQKTCRDLAVRLMTRHLYEPIYAARLLEDGSLDERSYLAKSGQLERKKLFDPAGREGEEAKLAASAGIDESKVVIYCVRQCPGFQKIGEYIEQGAGDVVQRGDEFKSYRRVRDRHLALWWAYVFAAPELDSREKRGLASAAQKLFGLTNEVAADRREGVLFS